MPEGRSCGGGGRPPRGRVPGSLSLVPSRGLLSRDGRRPAPRPDLHPAARRSGGLQEGGEPATMALTSYQREVCRTIAENRIASGESYVAGAVALNELIAAPQISRDIRRGGQDSGPPPKDHQCEHPAAQRFSPRTGQIPGVLPEDFPERDGDVRTPA